ncbi:MAG TPA: imidazolonepropionase [Thermoanaerobaculia bacterium]|nr:imidazolonepropionase [Thermoanaerobaculia bacterium]
MSAADLLITNLSEVATPLGRHPAHGAAQGRVLRLPGAEVFCRGGRIAFVGNPAERAARFGDLEGVARLDGRRGTLVPGFVDAHTHLPWAGSRAHELGMRLAGRSYQEIAAAGGGILSTVAATRAASEEELTANVLARLDRMLDGGTTTAEAKSGYGLSLAAELKQLRAIRTAGRSHAITLVPTLMAAHEVPLEHREHRERYLDLVCHEITPAAAEEGLAHFCDVFCERGVFSVEESRRVLEAGRACGLTPRLHADEFVDSGAAMLAAELRASSADHLIAVSEEGIEALASAGVTALLLPGVSFFLRSESYAPARRLIAAGVPVALATDCNPGSSHTESMPFVFWLGVFKLRLTIEEALTAMTLNPACCLGLGEEIGTVEEGKGADLVLLEGESLDDFAYHLGVSPVRAVVKAGRRVR